MAILESKRRWLKEALRAARQYEEAIADLEGYLARRKARDGEYAK